MEAGCTCNAEVWCGVRESIQWPCCSGPACHGLQRSQKRLVWTLERHYSGISACRGARVDAVLGPAAKANASNAALWSLQT